MRSGLSSVLLLWCVGCSRSEAEKPRAVEKAPVVRGAPSAPSAAPERAAAAAPSPAEALSDANVRALVDAWLAAQNMNDFASYEKLYAPRFTGVKRAGSATQRFDRAAWMRDRKFLFKPSVRVEARGVAIAATPALARVSFEQRWSSSNFTDAGPKELVVVPSAEGPRIAREEMLSSTVLAETKPTGQEAVWIVDGDAVVLPMAGEDAWGTGPVRPDPGAATSAVRSARRDVDPSKLPTSVAAWRGRGVRVFDGKGKSCESKLVSLELRVQLVPHFGMAADWAGTGDSPGPARSPAEIAQAVWDLDTPREVLARLEPACRGIFALDVEAAVPEIVPPVKAPADVERAAVDALRALPQYQKLQGAYTEGAARKAPAPFYLEPQGKISVWSFTPKDGRALVLVSARGGDSCPSFVNMNAVFEKTAGGALKALGTPDFAEPELVVPVAGFDADGDGTLELLSGPEGATRERAIWRRQGQSFVRKALVSPANLDCPC